MAPKRKRRASPAPKGLAPGELLKRFMLPSSSATPWSWVGSEVTEPSQIRTEHKMAAYGFTQKSGFPVCRNKYAPLPQKTTPPMPTFVDQEDVIVVSDDDDNPQCSKKACRKNPRCLNYLGQDVWDNEAKAQALLSNATDLGDDPALLSRDPDTPVGLKNLGATCYANSSLQVWFRDIAFRNGVYGCQVSEGDEEMPIFNLQVTFAALQEGRESVFNPAKLVESLQLRTAEQQDAQEFSKLFMSHLDAEFKKQSSPAVRNLIASQFQGDQVYGTICHSCKYTSERSSDFLEIEVNIKANSRLEDRIKASLEPEILSNDNQYLCPQCNSLQDATRYTELRRLPPVLHFSLLRFVYDLNTMERKKSKHAITFPAVLDMGQFLKPHEANLYELRGVLLHKGGSAYHGHYEAQVYDTQLRSWFQFNDETVTRVSLFGDNRGGKSSTESAATGDKSKNIARKKRRIVVDSDDDDIEEVVPQPQEQTITSKDAYMLVYVRKDTVADMPDAGVDVKPPPLALRAVEQVNEAHDRSCEEHGKRVNALQAEFERKRETVMDIYRHWHKDAHSEAGVVVSEQVLKDWLAKCCVEGIGKVASDAEPHQPGTRTLSNSEIVCVHHKLDPDKAATMKVISREAYEAIVRETCCQFEPMMTVSDVCDECVMTEFKERLYEEQHPQHVKDFEAVQEVEDDIEIGYWISKSWLKDWKLQRPRMHLTKSADPSPDSIGYVESVTCDHGGLTPNHIGRKKISTNAKELLQGLFPDWHPPSTDTEICAICQASISMSKEDKRELRRKAEEEKARLKHMNNMAFRFFAPTSTDEPCAMLPTPFYTNWKRWVDAPTSHLRPDAIDTHSLTCPHSLLMFDPNCREDINTMITVIRREEWDILSSLYSTGPPLFAKRRVENSETILFDIEPGICVDCKTKRQLNWENAEITIQLTQPGKRPDPSSSQSNGGATGVRKSRRLRSTKQNDTRCVKVSKSTSVKDLKIEISNLFEIPTICQRLFFKDQELTDNEITIEQLGVLANEVVFLEQITEAMEIDDSDSEVASGSRRKPRDEGRGFDGTILGGGVTDSSRASSRDPTPVSMLVEKPCKACTFANPVGAQSCEICETEF